MAADKGKSKIGRDVRTGKYIPVKEASVVLATKELSVSDAVRLVLTRIEVEKALPFDLPIPNGTTLAAMREARAGGLPSAWSVEELMDVLNVEG